MRNSLRQGRPRQETKVYYVCLSHVLNGIPFRVGRTAINNVSNSVGNVCILWTTNHRHSFRVCLKGEGNGVQD